MHVRYDHRKLAFQSQGRWQKRRISKTLNLKEAELTAESLRNERRASDVCGGLLGTGKVNTVSNANAFQKKQNQHQRSRARHRRGEFLLW